MKFREDNSDEATLKELGSRMAQYRLNQNQTQDTLAQEAGVSKRTIHRVEHGCSTQASNLIRILRALRLLENLEALIPEPDTERLGRIDRSSPLERLFQQRQ
jgi:putative transcriptional regulator